MGCWNTEGEPRDRVLEAIRANRITNIVLAGDNVYPRVKKGPHEKAVFDAGIHGLRSKTIVTTAFGNHNLVEPEPGLPAYQRAFFGRPAEGPLYFCIEYDDAALIVLDTNIMETKAAVDEMAAFCVALITALGEKPYYIVQHEPYASYKTTKNPLLKNGDILLLALSGVANRPLAILCADTHNYQEGVIRVVDVEIRQIVVGTGGASSDDYNPDLPPLDIEARAGYIPINYTLDRPISVANAHQFGYYQMDGPAVGRFIPVFPWLAPAAAAAAAPVGTARRGGSRRQQRHSRRSRRSRRSRSQRKLRH
jgi:hypothetical protein